MEEDTLAAAVRELRRLEEYDRGQRRKARMVVDLKKLAKAFERATALMPLLEDADIESITINSDAGNFRFYPDGRVEDADDEYDESAEYGD